MKRKTFCLLLAAALLHFSGNARVKQTEPVSLAGKWRFSLDEKDAGVREKWFSRALPQATELPGSCEQFGFGTPAGEPTVGRLTRVVRYEGKAWYQRDIDIPQAWRGKRVELMLERCHWESNVWVDDKPFGMQNSLSAPHVYDLGELSPGRHVLTICIDNTYKIPVGTWVHALTEDTQGNWNGIIGRIELRATDPVWIRDVQIFGDRMTVEVGNATGRSVRATVDGTSFTVPDGGATVELPMAPEKEKWNEFAPVLHEKTVSLKASSYRDSRTVRYGVRKLAVENEQFTIDGVPFLMRGPVDECVYPLTGYPPMDKEEWARILSICKSYGFNYMRFHSWCPPEAAFAAADEAGFFFQIEIPLWTMDAPHFGQHPERDRFIENELDLILKTYGNHPSFALMAMGNESSGSLDRLVAEGRKKDSRHLYRCENGETSEAGDFFETGQRGVAGPRTDWDRWTVGAWIAGSEDGQDDRPKGGPVPTLSHEVGQWAMYPDFDEIAKYTGTLRAYNYEGYRRSLEKNGMLAQNKDFARASGLFSVLLYKDEIEASMRSWPHGGFQILEARDYPGQGTAIVGWLDAFWDSKGLIEPEDFRRFCGSTVVLARMPKRVYTEDETFRVQAELANYGPRDLKEQTLWQLKDEKGNTLAEGTLPAAEAPVGRVTSLGEISVPLAGAASPCRLIFSLVSGDAANDWNIWVYPARQSEAPQDVRIAYRYDKQTREALARGEKVLLFSDPTKGLYKIDRVMLGPDEVRLFEVKRGQNALAGSFLPAFWNLRLFNQVGTLGLLCDPDHPALAGFPTECHSDWQWADLLGRYSASDSFRTAGAPADYCDEMERRWGDVSDRSKAIVLNDTPEDFRPIVQVIDNYERNYKLGMIFETRVGNGKLLVCAMDLDTDAAERPAARQLKSSLLNYMAGESFAPKHELSADLLERILTFDEE